MAAKRTPSGKPRIGEKRNQNFILSDVVTFTGSVNVNLQRAIKRRNGTYDLLSYDVVGLTFEDAGGAATVHRLASLKLSDGTFNINASKETTTAGTYATATNACTVRWAVLVTG